jgi:hypothetical protein
MGWPETRSVRIFRDCQEQGANLGLRRIALDDAVQRRIAHFVDFPTLRVSAIQLRARPKLARAQIFRDTADALPNEIAAETDWSPFRADASQCNMNMRVFGIKMGHCEPFEPHAEVPLNLRHKTARQMFQVDSVPEFGRHDQFPETFVACLLPTLHTRCDVD